MKKSYILMLSMALTFSGNVFAQQMFQSGNGRIEFLEIPEIAPNEEVIYHTGYSLLYNETYEQATWVAYELTKEETAKRFDRNNKFIPDPTVKTGTASDQDYAGSGYDKGHLAPAADMEWSAAAMEESFYYSNMSPQEPGFNRGIWKKLEELVRMWAIENNSIYIVTGPVLTKDLPVIGPDRIAVPGYFYKVILDYNEPGIKGIGFIIPNTSSGKPLQSYSVTIDSVEKLTRIDFFPLLPDEQENEIEGTLDLNAWNWDYSKSNTEIEDESDLKQNQGTNIDENQKPNNSKAQTFQQENARRLDPVQCSGTAKSGERCKHMTYSPNGYCYQHGGN
jgi:endonuclease G